MPKVYANLVMAGRKTREDIPNKIAEEVGLILLERGFIDEDTFESQWKNKEVI